MVATGGNAADNDRRRTEKGDNRVLRGGGWNGSANLCRSALRGWLNPGSRGSDGGFRVAQ